jgi:hypothetical protein
MACVVRRSPGTGLCHEPLGIVRESLGNKSWGSVRSLRPWNRGCSARRVWRLIGVVVVGGGEPGCARG